jgi:hypothetical protein
MSSRHNHNRNKPNRTTPPSRRNLEWAAAPVEPNITISPRRLEANQANAQLSTGPRTEEGKARSSTNGLKLGLTSKLRLTPEGQALYEQALPQWQDPADPPNSRQSELAHICARLSAQRIIAINAQTDHLLDLQANPPIAPPPSPAEFKQTRTAYDLQLTQNPEYALPELLASRPGRDHLRYLLRDELPSTAARKGYWRHDHSRLLLALIATRPRGTLPEGINPNLHTALRSLETNCPTDAACNTVAALIADLDRQLPLDEPAPTPTPPPELDLASDLGRRLAQYEARINSQLLRFSRELDRLRDRHKAEAETLAFAPASGEKVPAQPADEGASAFAPATHNSTQTPTHNHLPPIPQTKPTAPESTPLDPEPSLSQPFLSLHPDPLRHPRL